MTEFIISATFGFLLGISFMLLIVPKPRAPAKPDDPYDWE